MKRARSWARNAPSTAVSASARLKKNSFGLSGSRKQATSVHGTQAIAVSATMKRFSPSIPS